MPNAKKQLGLIKPAFYPNLLPPSFGHTRNDKATAHTASKAEQTTTHEQTEQPMP